MNPPAPLAGRSAVITGASRGIGAATARALGDAGAAVLVCARNESDLQTVCDDLTDHGIRATSARCDVTDEDSVAALAGSESTAMACR